MFVAIFCFCQTVLGALFWSHLFYRQLTIYSEVLWDVVFISAPHTWGEKRVSLMDMMSVRAALFLKISLTSLLSMFILTTYSCTYSVQPLYIFAVKLKTPYLGVPKALYMYTWKISHPLISSSIHTHTLTFG